MKFPPPRRNTPHPPGAIRPLTYNRNLSEEPTLFGSDEPQSDVREPEAEKPDLFDAFWSAYPKKVAKPEARKAWDKAVKKHDPQHIIDAAKVYARSEQVERGFAKHPQGWLNGERFNDADLQPRKAERYVYHPGGIET